MGTLLLGDISYVEVTNIRIHYCIEDLANSVSKIRLLRLLTSYPDKEFTENEMAKLIKMSPNTVNLAMKEIRRSNLVQYRKLGKAHVYQCNTSSVLYELFRRIFKMEDALEEKLITLVRRRMNAAISCVLYGSFARKEEHTDSDLDILLIVKNKIAFMEKVDNLRWELEKKFGIGLSPVILTVQELKSKRNMKFIEMASHEGILICGKKLSEFYD